MLVNGQRFFTLLTILLKTSIGIAGSNGFPLSISLCAIRLFPSSVPLRSAFLSMACHPTSIWYSFQRNTIRSMSDSSILLE